MILFLLTPHDQNAAIPVNIANSFCLLLSSKLFHQALNKELTNYWKNDYFDVTGGNLSSSNAS